MRKYAQRASQIIILSVFAFLPFLNNQYIFYGTYAVKEIFLCLAALAGAVLILPRILSLQTLRINPYICVCLAFIAAMLASGTGNPGINRTLYFERAAVWSSVLFLSAACSMPSAAKIASTAVISNIAVSAAAAAQGIMFLNRGSFFSLGNDSFNGRVYSVFGNPDIFAAYLIAVIPLILYAYSVSGKKSLLLLALANAVLMGLTQSASGIMTLCAMALVWAVIFLKGKRRMFFSAIAVAAITGGILLLNGSKKDSAIMRCFLWDASARMAAAHPLAGTGAGNFRVLSPLFQSEALKAGSYPGYIKVHDEAYAHNDLMQFLSETGVIGLLAFLCLVLYPFYHCFRNRPGPSETKYFLFSMGGALVFSAANFPFEMPLITAVYAVFSFMLTGYGKQPAVPIGGPLKAGIYAVVICAAGANLIFIPDYLERGYLTNYMGYAAAKQLRVNSDSFSAKAARDYQLSFYTGILKSREGDFGKAVNSFKRALELFPGFAACMYNLGNAYYNGNDLPNAALWYGRLIDLDRSYSPAYNNLALIEKRNNNYPEAILLLTEALKWAPDTPEINYNLAEAYYHEGNAEKASVYLKKTFKIKADYEPALEFAKKHGFRP